MKIKIICQQYKKENEYIIPFTKFYLFYLNLKAKRVDIECPDKNSQQKAPDYFLIQPKIAVEVKEVWERKELEKLKSREYSSKRLQKALDKLIKEETLKGVYLLEYPWQLKIKRGEEEKIAKKIIETIKQNRKDFEIEGVGKFKVIGISEEKKNRIVLAFSGSLIQSINPAGTIYQNIAPNIETANKQLEEIEANKKILLLINKYPFGDTNDFIEALTYSYKDLLNYQNIDEIWLQRKTKTREFYHEILYDRNFLLSFDKKKIDSSNEQYKKLFEKWFYPLQKLGDEQKEKLFEALKQFLENKKPHQLFKDNFVRKEMVELGNWLAEKRRYEDVIWLIDKFIDDPDPAPPEKYKGDPEINYHQRIVNGEDPYIITTVLGRLAWVVQKLALQKDYIEKALNYTKKLLSHKNLYVKLQAIIPLIEISARRQWLEGWGERPRRGKYKKFHKSVFDLVDLVERNPNYKAIAKWLCHVFYYYKDLNTKEAEKVLDALKIIDESASLFIYFGIFRQRHYKNQNIKFNAKKLEKKLKEIIINKDEKYKKLQANIARYLWKILNENRNEFETIKPYIDLILKQPYQKDIYISIEKIISDWIKDKPEICIKWYQKMLNNISKFLKRKEAFQYQGIVWLVATEKIIEEIARSRPKILLKIVKTLIDFWKKGIYIGSPKKLFESFKLIQDEKQKVKVKKEFQVLYNSIKKLNSKIEKVK